MPLDAKAPSKAILGYTLKHRIGVGGYGEVWAADAPGGLPKAIKLIFGYSDEHRAQTELKSLNRIRQVRHPFLLSLERIEVVDGQLVVITELADMCLKTRFEECIASGLHGIPRDELLGYLRDAASALDFISQEFRLQHLDVKPENLLLLGGHVKVADFGLVKDIHDGTQSLLSGLTPAYAPPELFDGQPHHHSDQYSLAILFQELLTGQRPFDGVTAAQLASQHLRERPNLRFLPRKDQAVISRALSKDPAMRFSTCGAMVEELSGERSVRSSSTITSPSRFRNKSRISKPVRKPSLSEATLNFHIRTPEIKHLPRIDYGQQASCFRPTLFIGVGNTGTQVLKLICGRLNSRIGARQGIPSIRFLAIDTDPTDITDATELAKDSLDRSEVITLPLRRPEEYRRDAQMHLSWLSRRWIYNVPKSLQTEGIRPLGRLAFATNAEQLSRCLRQTISELIKPESLAESCERLQLEPAERPRIVVVGAISGGTCSGMAIDLAYLIRHIMREIGVADEELVGLFTHASSSNHGRRELAIANTLAFLNELYHFDCVEDYPGDNSCNLPPAEGNSTFNSTYLLHIGENLSVNNWNRELDRIAEYAFLGTATTCTDFVDQCRLREAANDSFPLRTMGISRATNQELLISLTQQLTEKVARNWTEAQSTNDAAIRKQASDILQSVSIKSMVQLVHEAIKAENANPTQTLTDSLLQQFNGTDTTTVCRSLITKVDAILGPQTPRGTKRPPFLHQIDSLCEDFPVEMIPRILSGIIQTIQNASGRFSDTIRLVEEINQQISSRCGKLELQLGTIQQKIEHKQAEVVIAAQSSNEQLPTLVREFVEIALLRFSMQSVYKLTCTLGPPTSGIREAMNILLRSINPAAHAAEGAFDAYDASDVVAPVEPWQSFDSDVEPGDAKGDCSDEFTRRLTEWFAPQLADLAECIDRQVQQRITDQLCDRPALSCFDLRESLLTELNDAARAVALNKLGEVPLEEIFDEEFPIEDLATVLTENAKPKLLECGGSIRWLHAHPFRQAPIERIVQTCESTIGQAPTCVPATLGDLTVCLEAEDVPLENVVTRLLKDRPDSIEFSARLHTRTDISWTPISVIR